MAHHINILSFGRVHMEKENSKYKSIHQMKAENEEKLEISSTGYGLENAVEENETKKSDNS